MTNARNQQIPADRDVRPTVIPAPRSGSIFPGWGVKF